MKLSYLDLISLIRKYYCVILPALFIAFWLFVDLLRVKFVLGSEQDFDIFYNAGKQIFIDPSKLYEINGFFYLPSFAILFSISFSLFPLVVARYLFYFTNYVFAVLIIREYNKILILKNIKERSHRFIFLMLISNGYFVYYLFRFNQSKFLLFFFLLYIIRQELKVRNKKKEHLSITLKYYLINYALFIFAVSMAPYIIFLLIFYMFQDISSNKLFKKQNVKIYCIVIGMFLIQNFLFIIFPSMIFDFLSGFSFLGRENLQLFYLREWVSVPINLQIFITIPLTIILCLISTILLFIKKLQIEEKFGYFCLVYLFIGIFSYQIFLLLILFGFILLLIIPFLNQDEKGITFKFIQKNILLLLFLLTILIIAFMPPDFVFFSLIPILEEFPFIILVNLRWIVLLIIMMGLFLSLFLVKKNRN